MENISYDRRVYELVDDSSLSLAMPRILMGKIIQVIKG